MVPRSRADDLCSTCSAPHHQPVEVLVRLPAFLSNLRFPGLCTAECRCMRQHAQLRSEGPTSFRICLVQSFSSLFKMARCAFSWAIGSAGTGSPARCCAQADLHTYEIIWTQNNARASTPQPLHCHPPSASTRRSARGAHAAPVRVGSVCALGTPLPGAEPP